MDRKFTVLLILALFINFGLMLRATAETKGKEKKEEKKSISQLIQELKSDKKLTRARAAEELGNRKDTKAVPHLMKALKDKDLTVKWQACAALGKIKDKSAVPALIERLKDKKENWSVKKRAAESLVNIGVPEAFNALVDVFKYECEVERKFEYLDPPPRHSNVSPDEYTERIFSQTLRGFIETTKEKELKELYISSLVKYKDDEKLPRVFRYRVGIILGQLHQKSAVMTLIDCLEKSKRGQLRSLSAGLLGRLGAKEAIPHLKQALKDDFLSLGYRVSKDVGEAIIKGDKIADGKAIFSAGKIEQEGDYYRVRSYTVRNNAAVSLHDLGVKVIKEGSGYEIIE